MAHDREIMRSYLSDRKKYWFFSAGWVALIYLTLSIVRSASNFLGNVLPSLLYYDVFVVVSIITVITIFFFRFRIKYISTAVLLIGLIGIYIIILYYVKYPDEKIHFIQYGLLAYFLFRALRCDYSRIISYIGAFVLTTLFGWGDEIIQYFLPSRYYDLRDVGLNAISGLLSLCLVFILEREIRERTNAPVQE